MPLRDLSILPRIEFSVTSIFLELTISSAAFDVPLLPLLSPFRNLIDSEATARPAGPSA